MAKKKSIPIQDFISTLFYVKSLLQQAHPNHLPLIQTYSFKIMFSLFLLHSVRHKEHVFVKKLSFSEWTTIAELDIVSNPDSLLITWFQSVRLIYFNKKELRPFWDEKCQVISPQLWLPTPSLPTTNSNISCLEHPYSIQNDNTFTATKILNPNPVTIPHEDTFFQPDDEWEVDSIRTRKIKLYPTQEQSQIMLRWIGTTRYVYNRSLAQINLKAEPKISFFTLRDKYVTAKNNKILNDWELDTPKDVRAGAIKDLVDGYFTLCKMVKERKISHFRMKFKTRKKPTSILIPSKSVNFDKEGGVKMFPTYLKSPIKMTRRQNKEYKGVEITSDCRLQLKRGNWFLCVPIDVKNKKVKHEKYSACALDPGVRKFQTIYSGKEVLHVGVKREFVRKLFEKLDTLRSLRDRKIIKRWRRKENKIQDKLENVVDDLHYKTISYLTRTYKTIIIPVFESQDMVMSSHNKKMNRYLLQYKHYRFRMRLKMKCEERNCRLIVCTEEYTSKTCGRCGHIKNLKGEETYKCLECGIILDRDINGARNIYMKVKKEKE